MKTKDLKFDPTYWITTFTTDSVGESYGVMKIDPTNDENQIVESYNFLYNSEREKFIIENDIQILDEVFENVKNLTGLKGY